MQKQFITTYEEWELKELVRSVLKEILSQAGIGKQAANKPEPSAYLTIEEAAAMTGLAKSTLYEKTHLKEIPHYKRGRRLYFRRDEIEEWIKGGKVRSRTETEMEAATVLNRANQRTRHRAGSR